MTVSEKQNAYAEELVARMSAAGLRVKADTGADKLGAKIRNARLMRVPYIGVLGDKEVETQAISPRSRDLNKDLGTLTVSDFIEMVKAESTPPRADKRS